MSIKQKAITGVIWSAIEGWGRQVATAAIFFVLARLLGPDTYGLVALAGVYLAFVQVFLDQGLSEAIVQCRELEKEHLDTAFWINLGISLLLTALSISCAGLVANLFNEPKLTLIIRWLSLSFIIRAFSVIQQALFERKLAFKALTLRSLIAVVVSGAIGISMALMGFGVWSLVGQQLSNWMIQVIVLWVLSDWRPSLGFSRKHFRELFSFGINVLGIKVIDFANRRSDDLLIGYFLGSTQLGYYSIAYRLLLIMTDLLTGITSKVAMPTFSRLQDEPERLKRAFYKVTQFTSFISFPAFLGTAALAPEIIEVLFGKQWLPSAQVLRILAFIGIIHSVYYFNGTVILAMGKPFWRLLINSLHAIANITAFVLVVHWGISAVAAAYVIRSYILSPIDILAIRKLIFINLSTYFSQYISPLAGSLGMVLTMLFVKSLLDHSLNLALSLVISSILGVAVYVGLIKLLSPSQFQEIFSLVIAQLFRKTEKRS